MENEVAWAVCPPENGRESGGASGSLVERQVSSVPLSPGPASCWTLKSITMLPCSGEANPLVGESQKSGWRRKLVEEEAGGGPGLLPTQIIESLLTHFCVLTNPHLLTT